MRAFVLSVFVAAGLAAVASPASAQGFGVYVSPHGGVGVGVGGPRHHNDYDDWRVTQREAVRIARRNGMAEIYDVQRTPRAWVVRGENYKGRRVSMRIDRNGGWSW